MNDSKKKKEKTKYIRMPSKRGFQFKIQLNFWKILLIGLLILFFLPSLFALFGGQGLTEKVEISQALTDIKEEKISNVVVENERLILTYKDGSMKTSIKEENQ
ncbi:MAG: ATP-dependent metallopeptidase FtsH/Yme1/Tma family protein, partial [Patescibacteria group bacterium]